MEKEFKEELLLKYELVDDESGIDVKIQRLQIFDGKAATWHELLVDYMDFLRTVGYRFSDDVIEAAATAARDAHSQDMVALTARRKQNGGLNA